MDNSVVRSFALFKGATDCTDPWSVPSLNSVVSEQYAFGAALSLGQRTFLAFGELMTSTLDMDRGFAPPQLRTPGLRLLLLCICDLTPYCFLLPRLTCVNELMILGRASCWGGHSYLEPRSRDLMMML